MSDINDSSAAARLASFAVEMPAASIPVAVSAAAKLHLLDALGCGLAASALGVGAHARAVVCEWGGEPAATVIGSRSRLPAPAAALANGSLCHALDFDDTHPASICHVTVVVGPAVLAAAQRQGVTGEEVVAALVVGNEVVTRVGAAAASAYMTRGFHPTSVCGVFGAAAAAARIAGLDTRTTSHALGLAGSTAAGLFEYLADGAETKPLHAGWAAQSGVSAAHLAAEGATGPATVLEGRFGLYHAYFDGPSAVERELSDLGMRWETPNIAFKPYPACHFIHSCLDAAREAAEGIGVDEIEEVVVSIPAPGVPLVLEPLEAKLAPRTDYDAKFSLPYSVAAMLVHGEVGLATYEADAIRDARVLELAARVRYAEREFPTYPEGLPGRVELRLRNGADRVAELQFQRGGSQYPMDEDEVVRKFRANAALALAPADTETLERGILTLERQADLGFLDVLARASSRAKTAA